MKEQNNFLWVMGERKERELLVSVCTPFWGEACKNNNNEDQKSS
jgi:hypothetical protein